jgi:hypothetical protein
MSYCSIRSVSNSTGIGGEPLAAEFAVQAAFGLCPVAGGSGINARWLLIQCASKYGFHGFVVAIQSSFE